MSKITVFTARKVVTMDPGRPVAEASEETDSAFSALFAESEAAWSCF